MSVDFDVRGLQEMNFFIGGSIIMEYGFIFGQKRQFEIGNFLMMDLFLTNILQSC